MEQTLVRSCLESCLQRVIANATHRNVNETNEKMIEEFGTTCDMKKNEVVDSPCPYFRSRRSRILRCRLSRKMRLAVVNARSVHDQILQDLKKEKKSTKTAPFNIIHKALMVTPFNAVAALGNGGRDARFGHECFTLGVVRNYAQGLQVSVATCLFPELTEIITLFLKRYYPATKGSEPSPFTFSSIHINKNYPGQLHTDRFNVGEKGSVMFACGDYDGGELFLHSPSHCVHVPGSSSPLSAYTIAYDDDSDVKESTAPPSAFKLPTRNTWIRFDGTFPHMTFPYSLRSGPRFSVIFYTTQANHSTGSFSWRGAGMIKNRKSLRGVGIHLPVDDDGGVETVATPRLTRHQRLKRAIRVLRCLPRIFNIYRKLKIEEASRRVARRRRKRWDDEDSDESDFNDTIWETRVIGRKVEKFFQGYGLCRGTVTAFDVDRDVFTVLYEDGDDEEFYLDNLRAYLVTRCATCGKGGNDRDVVLCDGRYCVNEFHLACVGCSAVPSGKWYGPCCGQKNEKSDDRTTSPTTSKDALPASLLSEKEDGGEEEEEGGAGGSSTTTSDEECFNISPVTSMHTGTRIHGRFRGRSKWYAGRIVAIHKSSDSACMNMDTTVDVLYDDGDVEANVPLNRVRLASLVEVLSTTKMATTEEQERLVRTLPVFENLSRKTRVGEQMSTHLVKRCLHTRFANEDVVAYVGGRLVDERNIPFLLSCAIARSLVAVVHNAAAVCSSPSVDRLSTFARRAKVWNPLKRNLSIFLRSFAIVCGPVRLFRMLREAADASNRKGTSYSASTLHRVIFPQGFVATDDDKDNERGTSASPATILCPTKRANASSRTSFASALSVDTVNFTCVAPSTWSVEDNRKDGAKDDGHFTTLRWDDPTGGGSAMLLPIRIPPAIQPGGSFRVSVRVAISSNSRKRKRDSNPTTATATTSRPKKRHSRVSAREIPLVMETSDALVDAVRDVCANCGDDDLGASKSSAKFGLRRFNFCLCARCDYYFLKKDKHRRLSGKEEDRIRKCVLPNIERVAAGRAVAKPGAVHWLHSHLRAWTHARKSRRSSKTPAQCRYAT